MNSKPIGNECDCQDARRAIQERADGTLAADVAAKLDAHLASCNPCSHYADELDNLTQALASLPDIPLPDDALERVWNRTIHADRRETPFIPRRFIAAAIAAAAVIAMAVVGFRSFFRPAEPSLSEQELARLAAQTRMVFELTNNALRRVQRAAFDEILAKQVSPALGRIPVSWTQSDQAENRRSGT